MTPVEILSQLVVERANAAVWVDLISVVMVVSIVVVDAKAKPSTATARIPPTVDGQAMGWIWLG
jgi:hypothetical protein